MNKNIPELKWFNPKPIRDPYQFVRCLYDIYEDYNMDIYLEYPYTCNCKFTIKVYLIINNKRHHIITKKYDIYEFRVKANGYLEHLVEEVDSILKNMENMNNMNDNQVNGDKPLKPLKCPCCNGNITNKTKCDYCGTLFEL